MYNAIAEYRHGDLISLSSAENLLMEPIDPKQVGERIRARRLALGMGQADLAGASGIKQPSLSAIEKGETKEVTARVLSALCRSLGLAWEYVLHGIGDEFTEEQGARQAELIHAFRSVNEAGQMALLQAARAVLASQPPERIVERVIDDPVTKRNSSNSAPKIGAELSDAFLKTGDKNGQGGKSGPVQKPRANRRS